MRLGNSGGNNRGKKYLDRNNLDYSKLTAADYARLDSFNLWYVDNIMQIQSELMSKGSYDDDIVNDTYIKMCESILFAKLNIKDFKGYFSRAYYTNYIQERVKESRYCNFYEHVDVEERSRGVSYKANEQARLLQDNDEYVTELENKQKELQDAILEYVSVKYKDCDFETFKTYVSMKPDINYHALAKQTGQKYHTIQRTVSTIIMDVKTHTDFHKKRENMTYNKKK